MLAVNDLHKSYGTADVLRGVTLHIQPGEVVGLLGANGAGKTTLVSIVMGLRRADRGSVAIAGHDALADPWRARELLGVAPQDLGVYPTLTAERNLRLFAHLAGLRGRRGRARIEEVAEALGLTDLLRARVSTLSGGQQRRLHTAMALLHRPRLLFLDEPTVGADVHSRRQILQMVRQLADDGCAVCYATHYLPEVEELDARVAVLHEGRIVADASVADLVRRHGQGTVRLGFRTRPPDIAGMSRRNRELLAHSDDPARAVRDALSNLGPALDDLEGVQVSQPSLESAYLAVTGHGPAAQEVAHAS